REPGRRSFGVLRHRGDVGRRRNHVERLRDDGGGKQHRKENTAHGNPFSANILPVKSATSEVTDNQRRTRLTIFYQCPRLTVFGRRELRGGALMLTALQLFECSFVSLELLTGLAEFPLGGQPLIIREVARRFADQSVEIGGAGRGCGRRFSGCWRGRGR